MTDPDAVRLFVEGFSRVTVRRGPRRAGIVTLVDEHDANRATVSA
ncbi:MAG: hypothetical protein R2706_02705 [Acidimicrobiales bacterium]